MMIFSKIYDVITDRDVILGFSLGCSLGLVIATIIGGCHCRHVEALLDVKYL